MIYLLAYPRSGSSFIRYILGYLTESKPMQPGGHCEMDHILQQYYKREPFIKKFHYPNDIGHSLPVKKGDKLCLLRRTPIENILSYMFSNEHVGQKKEYDDKYIHDFLIKSMKNSTINSYIHGYKENIKFFRTYPHAKAMLSYEEIMLNPKQYLANYINFFNIAPARLESLIENWNEHFNIVMNHKTKKTDPFMVNTKGVDLTKFRKLGKDVDDLFHKKFQQ